MEISEFLLGLLSSGILIIVSQIIGHYFSRKNLKAQQEHSVRIVREQLLHEDRKKALIELNELLMKWYKTYPEFAKKIRYFLNGKSGIFLPTKLRKELEQSLKDIDDFVKIKQLELFGPPPEPEDHLDDYEKWIPPQEEINKELKSRLGGLKGSMRDKIKKYISEE